MSLDKCINILKRKKPFLPTELEIRQAGAVEKRLDLSFYHFSDATFQHCFELINIPWTIYIEGLFKNVFCQTIFPSYENCYFTPFLIPPGSIDLKPLWKGQYNGFFKPNYLETRPQTLMMPGNIVFYWINMTWIIVWMVT